MLQFYFSSRLAQTLLSHASSINKNLFCHDALRLRKWAGQRILFSNSGPTRGKLFLRSFAFAGSYIAGLGGLVRHSLCQKAYCKAGGRPAAAFGIVPTRPSSFGEPSLTFRELWTLIRPYIGWFLGAVISAICVAVLNIRLPLILGELINEITSLRNSQDLALLTPVAVKLIGIYAAQAVMTFVYISLLSIAGERVAADLRTRLFSSLVRQDIAFFDRHRTGELMSRLAADVQEFKSSFKLCISVGLRSVMQTGGCIVSLYLISPKMTTVTVLVLPVVIGLGTLLGSGLRALSRKGQEQAAKAMSTADEALGNIRTVRAFAMENVEEM